MFRSATFKLTMWYLAIVMSISLVFSVVLYHEATDELGRGLQSTTQRIYSQFPIFKGDPLFRTAGDYYTGAHRIFWRLVAWNMVVLIGAGGASYWLAKRTLEPIEEAHEQQKRFTADVSHELRTPLTALKMESEVALMNDKNGTKELQAVVRSNLEEAGKLEALINNLLRLTRLEAGELQQSFKKLGAESLAKEAVEQVSKLAKENGITLATDMSAAETYGDQASLVQLLVILLDNAIKYSPAKSTIQLRGYAENDRVVFEVSDQGSGIKRESLTHVFDRFYRGSNDSRTKQEADGFGLGLSIAQMIIDLHHGSITLTSKPGKGTIASVSLPAATS